MSVNNLLNRNFIFSRFGVLLFISYILLLFLPPPPFSPSVFEPPNIDKTYTVNESSSLSIYCDTSNSAATYVDDVYWLYPDGRTKGGKKLKIDGIARSDAGLYSCVVVSIDGEKLNATTEIIVQCKHQHSGWNGHRMPY